MTYEPTEAQIDAAYAAYIFNMYAKMNDKTVIRDGIRAALIAAEKAAWRPAKDAPQDTWGQWTVDGREAAFQGELWPDGRVVGSCENFPLSKFRDFRPLPPPPEQST
jgi:hypothetical protein